MEALFLFSDMAGVLLAMIFDFVSYRDDVLIVTWGLVAPTDEAMEQMEADIADCDVVSIHKPVLLTAVASAAFDPESCRSDCGDTCVLKMYTMNGASGRHLHPGPFLDFMDDAHYQLEDEGRPVAGITLQGTAPLEEESFKRYTMPLLRELRKRYPQKFFGLVDTCISLNNTVAGQLKHWDANEIRISLQGPKDWHDQRQRPTDGKSGFDRSFAGLMRGLEYGLPMAVATRLYPKGGLGYKRGVDPIIALWKMLPEGTRVVVTPWVIGRHGETFIRPAASDAQLLADMQELKEVAEQLGLVFSFDPAMRVLDQGQATTALEASFVPFKRFDIFRLDEQGRLFYNDDLLRTHDAHPGTLDDHSMWQNAKRRMSAYDFMAYHAGWDTVH